jgi:hypothetical protein
MKGQGLQNLRKESSVIATDRDFKIFSLNFFDEDRNSNERIGSGNSRML